MKNEEDELKALASSLIVSYKYLLYLYNMKNNNKFSSSSSFVVIYFKIFQ